MVYFYSNLNDKRYTLITSSPAVLNLGVATPLGGRSTLCKGVSIFLSGRSHKSSFMYYLKCAENKSLYGWVKQQQGNNHNKIPFS